MENFLAKRVILGGSLMLFFGAGCSSRPVIMKNEDVKVSRDEPSKKCAEVGRITGTTTTAHGTSEEALEDLKKEAAHKGANYVKVGEFSGMGTAVLGTAYICP